MRDYALEAHADPDGVRVIDDEPGTTDPVNLSDPANGFLKKGGQSLGACADPQRRAKAHVPEEIAFATNPFMAREMVAHLLDEGIPCAFILSDAAYGADTKFRRILEERQQPYVLAVRSNQT